MLAIRAGIEFSPVNIYDTTTGLGLTFLAMDYYTGAQLSNCSQTLPLTHIEGIVREALEVGVQDGGERGQLLSHCPKVVRLLVEEQGDSLPADYQFPSDS